MTEEQLKQRFIDYKAHRITLTDAITGINLDSTEIKDSKFSRCLIIDGCLFCQNNKPGLEAGLYCITNCIKGSMFQKR